jgi:hypothetical protein
MENRTHDGCVVLRDKDRRVDSAGPERLGERSRRPTSEIDETGIEEGRVLLLEQADPPELVGQGDLYFGVD